MKTGVEVGSEAEGVGVGGGGVKGVGEGEGEGKGEVEVRQSHHAGALPLLDVSKSEVPTSYLYVGRKVTLG